MTLQSLLVSTDNSSAEVLGRVLPTFGIMMGRSSDPETTLTRIQQQKFEALIVDFDDAALARDILQLVEKLGSGCLTVALVADHSQVRDVLSSGAHFVLYKPVSEDAAKAGLRAVAALLNRERRRAVRIPVQGPVEVWQPDGRKVDGILLDLSETGMDVLTSEPQIPGALLRFQFTLPDGTLNIDAHGQVAWANPNGQTGVYFLDLAGSVAGQLKTWLNAAALTAEPGTNESVPHCKLTDLSLGGCYVETAAPFPERALVDLCLRSGEHEVHTEGMVRVAHPAQGMGVEFPSRTAEQRAQVENLINFLRSSPDAMPELSVSPRALVADLMQFESRQPEHGEENGNGAAENAAGFEDPLLELLRRGASLQQEEFLSELQHQRCPDDVASV